MNSSDDPYVILGLDRSATVEQVQAAYREKSRRYHPDVGGDAWAFKKLQEAFESIVAERQGSAGAAHAEAETTGGTPSHAEPTKQSGWYEQLPVWQQWAIIVVVTLLTAVLAFGLTPVLWCLCVVAILAAGVGVWASRFADNDDERHGVWWMSGASFAVGVGIWLVIGWLGNVAPPDAQAMSPPQSARPSATSSIPATKSNESTGWSLPSRSKGVINAVKMIYDRFGSGGIIAAFVIVTVAYGAYDSWRSRSRSGATPNDSA